ncbi:MAG: RICIN domain-containing protein, partial [Clostridia bacterium]|nr:RICIN domain-containing protein [Clostridia bacterium]
MKKFASILLSFVMLLSVFTLTGTYAEEETGLLGVPPDETQEETVVDEDGSENDVYPDGTRSVYHFFLGAYSDGDLLTFSNLHSSPTETRYSDGNNNNHKYQKWEISYYNSHYTLYPLGGENPYALTVNPTTLAVTVEPYYSTDVCQRWDITILGHGRIYLTSLATGTDAYGYKLVVNGSSVTVSSSSYTTFLIADYDTYVGSTSLSYGNFYLAPGSTRMVFPTNQTGLNVPTGAIKLTSSNSKVAVSYNIVTGKTSGTATLTIKDKITNAQTTCTVNVTPIANATYYLKNRQTDYYARVKNGTMADGTNAVQYELDGTEYEKWQFSLNSSTGYYTIKSKGSSSAYYLTVKNSVSTLNQEIVLGTSSTANGAQWKVVATTNGAYKLVPKTGENAGGSGVDYVLATNTSLHTNNANLIQGKYLNNSSYRDEWYILRTDKKFSQITLYNDSSISTASLHESICQYYNQNAHINGNCITSITEANYVNELKTNDYLCTITHGGETENK